MSLPVRPRQLVHTDRTHGAWRSSAYTTYQGRVPQAMGCRAARVHMYPLHLVPAFCRRTHTRAHAHAHSAPAARRMGLRYCSREPNTVCKIKQRPDRGAVSPQACRWAGRGGHGGRGCRGGARGEARGGPCFRADGCARAPPPLLPVGWGRPCGASPAPARSAEMARRRRRARHQPLWTCPRPRLLRAWPTSAPLPGCARKGLCCAPRSALGPRATGAARAATQNVAGQMQSGAGRPVSSAGYPRRFVLRSAGRGRRANSKRDGARRQKTPSTRVLA